MEELKPLITEWLTEYNNLKEDDIKSFAQEHEHNHEVASALYSLFSREYEESTNSKSDSLELNNQMLEDVCVQLFGFYRSREVELQRFTLQFVPPLICTYLSSVAKGNMKECRCIETLLIGIYNFEVVDEAGKPKVVSFRLPSLAQASIYHEPLSLGPQFLTESALRRWEECNTKLVNWGPLPQVEVINTQNRLKVMTALCFVYNRHLSLLPKLSLRHFCLSSSRIVKQGFQTKKDGVTKNTVSRIPVSSNFLLELIQGAYFAMFNELYTLALQAVQDVDKRAHYELFPEVMLVSSAVINSLKSNTSGQPLDGPMGISVALSPATTTVTMSKSMITNASFRTKKLPDDIPIQAGQAVPTESADALTSITEEGETDSAPIQRGSAARGSKAKLAAFPALGKKLKEGKERAIGGGEKKVTVKTGKVSASGDSADSASPPPQKRGADAAEANGAVAEDTSESAEDVDPPRAHMQVSSV